MSDGPRLFPPWIKFGLVPGGIAKPGARDGAGIDDDVLAEMLFKFQLTDVAGSGLEGIEEEPGGFEIKLAGGDEAHDLHKRDLDGVGVLEDGQGEADGGLGAG